MAKKKNETKNQTQPNQTIIDTSHITAENFAEEAKKLISTYATPESINKFKQNYIQEYSNAMERYYDYAIKYGDMYKNPIYANTMMKQMNPLSVRPALQDIVKWMDNPSVHEKELRDTSEFLTNAVTQYGRSVSYFANMLYLGYELIPKNTDRYLNVLSQNRYNDNEIDYQDKNYISEKTENEKMDKVTFVKLQELKEKNPQEYEKTIYLKCLKKAENWLRSFRLEDNFSNVERDVWRTGGRCYNVRAVDNGETFDNGICLQAMPDDYCYIDGRTEKLGFTFSINMAYFLQFPDSIAGFAPEFARWFADFLYETKEGKSPYPFKGLPPESSVVFKFDDSRPEIVPPLAGSFKDALEIQDFKDLLKLRVELDTYQIIFLEAPLDKDGKPTIDAGMVANYMAAVQLMLPPGVVACGTPFKVADTKLANAQNMNNIVGDGNANYWRNSGISNALFGETKSAKGINLGLEKDYLNAEPLYNQFERFINYHLSQLSGKYKFEIRFIRCPNFPEYISKERDKALQAAQSGASPTTYFATMGMKPYQVTNSLVDANIRGLRDLMIPIMSTNQMSGGFSSSGGRPTNESAGREDNGDSADDTRSGGYNEE